jgi:hypothetical protein
VVVVVVALVVMMVVVTFVVTVVVPVIVTVVVIVVVAFPMTVVSVPDVAPQQRREGGGKISKEKSIKEKNKDCDHGSGGESGSIACCCGTAAGVGGLFLLPLARGLGVLGVLPPPFTCEALGV